MQQFKQDRHFLLKYCVATVALFAAIDYLLWRAVGVGSGITLNPADALWPVAALLLCGLPSSLMHNAAHGNVGKPAFNRLVGEFCGTIMLYGFGGFRLGHVFHHKYPDNPQYDPHPPRGLTFARFLVAPVEATLVVVETAYFERFGRNSATERSIAWQRVLFQLSIVLKVAFWFLLLGPKVFTLFYLPLYVANIFVFAHINFATHVEGSTGQMEIINLSDGLYYRIVNVLSCGGYFHKNHHLRPKAFNPMRVPVALDKPLTTFRDAAVAGRFGSATEKKMVAP